VNGALDQIEAAIQRIEDDGYGRCEEFGEQIPKTRLDVIPNVAKCVRQEEDHEAIKKQRKRGITPNDRSDHPRSES
jgi:RNA polymerase-binding transcription factor DksA